jgi:hypothetical protein
MEAFRLIAAATTGRARSAANGGRPRATPSGSQEVRCLSNYSGSVAKTWVLDTATKGTGASIVPLERVEKRPAPSGETLYVPPKPRPKERPEPAPRRPRRFKVVDVLSRETLAEDVDLRGTLRLLRDVRSTVDIHISVRDAETGAWRLLSVGEQRALWAARARVDRDGAS